MGRACIYTKSDDLSCDLKFKGYKNIWQNDSWKNINHFCGSIRKTKVKGGLDVDSIEVYVWLIVFIVLTAIEMATFQLVTIWFAVGAVAAFITSLFSTSLEIQLIVFLAVSMLLLILVRPIAGRFLQTKTVKTNVDSLIGDYATVTARIHNQEGFGKAVIRGQEWTAAAEKDDEIIEAGSRVVVTGIRGVKLIVAKIEQSRTAQENS